MSQMRASAVIGCIKRGWGGVRFENPDAPETIGHLWNAGGKPPTGFVRTVRWAIGRQPPRPSRRDAPDSHGGGTTTGAGHLRVTLWLRGNYGPRGLVRSLLLTAGSRT